MYHNNGTTVIKLIGVYATCAAVCDLDTPYSKKK